MLKQSIKRNFVFSVLFAIVAVLLAFALAAPVRTANAAGNDAGNADPDAAATAIDISLKLDVNGLAYTGSTHDTNVGAIETNNGSQMSSRWLPRTTVVAAYNAKHPSAAITDSYYFDQTSVTKDSDSFDVAVQDGNTDITITAKDAGRGRFTVFMNYGDIKVPVRFYVEVDNTFAVSDPSQVGDRPVYYVGNSLDANGEVSATGDIWTVYNYSEAASSRSPIPTSRGR